VPLAVSFKEGLSCDLRTSLGKLMWTWVESFKEGILGREAFLEGFFLASSAVCHCGLCFSYVLSGLFAAETPVAMLSKFSSLC